ncbi:Copper chaperone for superoxide dismutase chloroplastic [Bienertia sinuspersici]
MTILRSIATTIAIAGTAIPATYIATSFSNSPPSSSFSKFLNSRFFSPQLALSSVTSSKSGFIKNLTSPPSAESSTLPELTTEFMVDMKCEGCVSAVKSKVETLEGVKMVEVDLSNQVVRFLVLHQ